MCLILKRNFCFDVYRRFGTTWVVTLYKQTTSYEMTRFVSNCKLQKIYGTMTMIGIYVYLYLDFHLLPYPDLFTVWLDTACKVIQEDPNKVDEAFRHMMLVTLLPFIGSVMICSRFNYCLHPFYKTICYDKHTLVSTACWQGYPDPEVCQEVYKPASSRCCLSIVGQDRILSSQWG